jgi:hypothetical protein
LLADQTTLRAWDRTWNDDPVRVLSVSHLLAEDQVQYVVTGTAARRAAAPIYDRPIDTAATNALANNSTRRQLGIMDQLSDPALSELVDALSRVYKSAAEARLLFADPLGQVRSHAALARCTSRVTLRAADQFLRNHRFRLGRVHGQRLFTQDVPVGCECGHALRSVQEWR